MTDQTLFNANDTVTPENYDLIDDGDDKDYLSQIVGDGKKFKDANALAKGKMQSDLFIQKLISEKRTLEEKLNSTQSMEDLIRSIKNDPPPANPGGERRPDEEAGFKPEDIQRIVEETVGKREQIAQAQRNLMEVTEALTQEFGPNYVQALKAKAQELGVGEEFLDDLARSRPKAFLSLIGVTGKKAPPASVFTPPPSRVNPAANADKQTGEKTYSYYEKIRKADPKLYASLQREMFEQAAKLGDSFYS